MKQFEYQPAQNVSQVAGKATELRRLELLVTRRLDGLLSGEYLGRLPGPGTEPAAARPYGAGDDARRIDWNLTARSQQPHVRSTEADRELETWLIVDRSASLDFGTTDREKSEVAFAAAAAFSFLAARHGNRVGMLVAGGDRVLRLGPGSTRTATLAMLSRLFDVPRRESAPAPGADLASAMQRLSQSRARRGQVIIISDFLDEHDWVKPLRNLAIRHDIVGCQILDPRELSLPPIGLVTVVDTETGREMHVQTNSNALRARYAAAAKERSVGLARELRRAGAEHFVLSTDRDWLLDIVKFMTRRRRVLRRGAAKRVEAFEGHR